MKLSILLLLLLSITCHALTVWQEDFEGAALGETSGNNENLNGTTVETANTASSIVVNTTTDPAASAFTLARGNFIRLSVGNNDFAAIRSNPNPIFFPPVPDTEVFSFTFNLYIPGGTNLDVPVGNFSPHLESNGASGNGPTFNSTAVSAPGQYTITYTGTVADFKNPNSTGNADTIRPFIYFEQRIDNADNGTTNDFVYVDNFLLQIGTSTPSNDWKATDYNDSSWSKGAGPIGYETSNSNPYSLGTNLTSMQGNNWSVYMRTSFHLTAPQLATINQLEFTVDYDDGYISYLNGQEISRGTMGNEGDFFAFNDRSDQSHGATTDNGGTFNAPTITIDASALQVGENVLAAQCHNATINSSDLMLYMELGDGTSTFVPFNATYSYFIGTSEPDRDRPALPPHGVTQNPAAEDQDDNGLPDLWEALYGAEDIDPDSDSDGDGLTNKEESILGTDPFSPHSKMEFRIASNDANTLTVSWTSLSSRPGILQSSDDLGNDDTWTTHLGTPVLNNGMWNLDIPTTAPHLFFRLQNFAEDLDNDGIPDWLEPTLGFTNLPNSTLQGKSYDTDGDGNADVSLSGDLTAYNEIYRIPQDGESLTTAQAARLLLQTTYGPASMNQVEYVASIGAEAWIDEQIARSPTLTQPYIDAIKADLLASPNGQWSDSALSGYHINDAGSNPYVAGINYMTAWMRSSLQGPDQLRQRVAFALSQIIVASRNGAGLPNQPRSTAQYYDFMIDGAFGNYEDLLLKVSLSPYMGNYLSHIGNQKADPAAGRYPDENYAREIMQLFTIGLWELNPDGTQKLDNSGQPIPTYNNLDITNVAKVFTGTNYASNTFGGGWRDDGDSSNQWMTTPMKVFATHHDFTAKNIPIGIDANGNRLYHTIPARAISNANALQDVEDVVHQLVHHPNTAPFVCRQLIQFLITSNPSLQYVQRVASVFSNNGSGVTGDLEAVVKAILLDDEARNPMNHLKTNHFGHFREPTIRLVHLARILKLGQYPNLLWWDWGYYSSQSLQEPMASPSVFNFYRPDFRLFGNLAANQLDSPALGIVNSYSSISFTNYLWRICEEGFEQHGNAHRFWDNKQFPEDLSDLETLAGNIPDLLDHLSILYCAGTLGAESRSTISNILQSEPDLTDRARLAAFLVLISPEGSCLK